MLGFVSYPPINNGHPLISLSFERKHAFVISDEIDIQIINETVDL